MELNKQFLTDLKKFLDEINKTNIYSAGKVYEYYNFLFKKNEGVSLCRSCLIYRTGLIQKWYDEHKNDYDEQESTQSEKMKKYWKERKSKDKDIKE